MAATPPRTCRRGRAWRARESGRRRRPRSRSNLRVDRARALLGLALALLACADEDRDLAEVLVLAHELVRLTDAVEAHRAPQHRADLTTLDQLVGLVALVRVGEMRPDDLLLAHPEVADVEVEVVARGAGADHDLAERLDGEDRRRERGLADVLEHDVGRPAEDLLDGLAEAARLLEARLLLVGRLAALAHHALVLVAVDPAGPAEPLDELALLRRGDDADRLRARD